MNIREISPHSKHNQPLRGDHKLVAMSRASITQNLREFFIGSLIALE